MSIITNTRNANLQDLVALLQNQQPLKVDAVVPATKMRARDGLIVVKEGMAVFGEAVLRPTDIFDSDLADKLGIPVKYLRRMRAERPDLYDANVNGWLHGTGIPPLGGIVEPGAAGFDESVVAADPRSFFVRAFSEPGSEEPGIARSLQSDRYSPVDNLDVLMAGIAGINESGVETEFVAADLSERRMVAKFAAPSVQAFAPQLLKGYRSPFSGASGDENPVVFAGFEINNSETGGGAFTIGARLMVQVCSNGLKIDFAKFRRVHLGAKLDVGMSKVSGETRQRNLELITSQARDAVTTFLDIKFVEQAIADLQAKAGVPVADAAKTVELVATQLKFTEEQQAGILNHFILGGQVTAGGVMQAVTSYAQTVESPEEAYDLENVAVAAMELAAA